MGALFIYIFGRTFFIYEKIYADKDHPQYFSSSLIALLTVLSLAVITDIIIYPIDPSLITVFYDYYKFLAIAILFFMWWFFHPKKRYLKIVEDYKEISVKKKRLLGILSLVYILVLLVIFFKMSNLVRAYNLGE